MKTPVGDIRLRRDVAPVMGPAPSLHALPAQKPVVLAPLWTGGAPVCLWLLIVAAALNGLSFQLHHLSAYPEDVALGLVLVWSLGAVTLGHVPWYVPRPMLPLLLWLGAELLATILFAPVRHQSLVLWLKLPLMVATFLAVANLARGRVQSALTAQLTVAAGVALLALGAYASWKLTGSHLGMQQQGRNFGHGWLPAATLREPDILGSYLVAAGLLAFPIAALLRYERSVLSGLAWMAAGLTVLGTIVSGARTAWLALLAGLCVPLFVWMAGHPRLAARRVFLPGAVVAATLAALAVLHVNPAAALPAFNPHQNGDLLQRVVSLGSLSRERDVTVRFEVVQNALAHWQTHPLTGWGVGAYGEVFTNPAPDTIHTGWIPNLPVHLLYDSGLLGLATFAWAMAAITWRGFRAWRSASGLRQAVLAGLMLALCGLLIAFQATEATWFAYPWIYLGLLEAAQVSTPAPRSVRLELV